MTRRALWFSALALVLAVPRIARLLYPQVWVEDDSYLHGAFLLARGYMPYKDFPLPHFPLLEGMMAAVFLVAPISIRTAEGFSQISVFAASLLVFSIGRRLDGVLTGTVAALLFATSALLFRYHLFEREVFLILPVLAAVRVLMSPRDDTAVCSRQAVTAGVLLAGAIAIKLTAASAFAATIVWLLSDGRRRAAAVLAATTTAIVAAAFGVLVVRFGTDFIVQVFVFRLVHATFPSLGIKIDELRYTMDISLAFGAPGVALILWRHDVRRWLGPLVQLASGLVFLVVLNPTFWAHTGIELLPWFVLPSSYLLAEAWRACTTRAEGRVRPLVCTGAAIALLASVVPIRNVNWQPGDDTAFGFGYRDRDELEHMGAFVHAHSATDALVATPPLIAFVANRGEAVPYAEIAGTIEELTLSVRRYGYWKTVTARTGSPLSFWDSVEASRDRMAPRLAAALVAHRIAVVIDDSPDDLLPVPLVNLTPDDLKRSGYGLESTSAHYEAWVPQARR